MLNRKLILERLDELRDLFIDGEEYEFAEKIKALKKNFIDNKDIENKMLNIIYKHKNNNVIPSVSWLCEFFDLSKSKVHEIKKIFIESNILKTEHTCTVILCDYNEAVIRYNNYKNKNTYIENSTRKNLFSRILSKGSL